LARSLDVRSFKKELKQGLGVRSGLLLLYQQALRHRSALKEGDERFSNERLEFLGIPSWTRSSPNNFIITIRKRMRVS